MQPQMKSSNFTIKDIIDEDFVNYKVPSMMVITSKCSFKCEKDSGIDCCHNNSLVNQPNYTISDSEIIERYINNPITEAIVFAGLEPFDQFDELYDFINIFRGNYLRKDCIVIYTGYYKDEIKSCIEKLCEFDNIIVKYGRFIPNQEKHYDELLGVNLASPNQYAETVKI